MQRTNRLRPKAQLVASGLSDSGFGRGENQDAFDVDAENGLFIVADGIGGHRDGATAAKATVAGLRALVNKARKAGAGRTMRWLRDTVRQLNALHGRSLECPAGQADSEVAGR